MEKKKQTIIQWFVNSLPFCGYVIAHVADTQNSSGPVGQPMEPEENIQRWSWSNKIHIYFLQPSLRE